ncbi:hypothetical protein [Streptomonospora wellingtoniae]|uniref:Uncharacterized protein n=1 Tax=Streptomonospora wellingtoniae TaxID=3075544 RepID=A0ABU2KXL3_9ACTN|nr:hypothetical protein [Streptomonospora sp. DSM 45055]MDT0303990.1 hypothetical protein [Streptomonospora sp. DSM 45055]
MAPLALLLALSLIVVTLGYAGMCAASPFGPCRRCVGARPTSRRLCHRCHGTGLQSRMGWRLVTYLQRLNRDSTR